MFMDLCRYDVCFKTPVCCSSRVDEYREQVFVRNNGVHAQAASGHVYESVLEYSDGYKHILVMMHTCQPPFTVFILLCFVRGTVRFNLKLSLLVCIA